METESGFSLLGFETRFIFPFFMNRGSVAAATLSLEAVPVAGETGAWERSQPPDLYRDELLDHVGDHFFPSGLTLSRASYLRISKHFANRIFHTLIATIPGRDPLRVHLGRPAGVELFISSQGVGLVSVALEIDARSASPEVALRFNCLGASRHLGKSLFLEIPHPASDARRWAAIPEEKRQQIKPAPAGDAPIELRLGAAGGRFTLNELVTALVSPLAGHGLRPAQSGSRVANEPCVYTAFRFDAAVGFEDPAVRRRLGPLLGALAQVEEPQHAGAVADDLGVPTAILNAKHWAAVGQLGASHIVADQAAPPGGHAPGFNEERLTRVMTKYFIPYLVGLLERLTLQRTLADAALCVQESGGSSPSTSLTALRDELLAFEVGGHFTQVTVRQALHRYHQLTRAGLDVIVLWEEVRRTVEDLDSRQQVQLQHHLTEGIAQSLRSGLRMQHALHVIEVFLVAVYSAHFVLMIIETLHPIAREHHALERFLNTGSPILVGGAAVLGFLITRRIVQTQGRHRADLSRRDEQGQT